MYSTNLRAKSSFIMPDETATQACIWVAFGASRSIWGNLYKHVQIAIGRMVHAMAPFTSINILCRAEEEHLARKLCGEYNTQFFTTRLNDIWLRDTGGVFIRQKNGSFGLVDFNFNGWGKKQDHNLDATIAAEIAKISGVFHLQSQLIGEGGGIEVDGHGTGILTESCWLNNNRNPGIGKVMLEAYFRNNLGLRKIIWLPGIKGKDITDGHVDFYVRFIRPGVVVVNVDNNPLSYDYALTRHHLAILQQATDAEGRLLQIYTLPPPLNPRNNQFSRRPEFAAGYINYLTINGAVITPEFGDGKADYYCRNLLAELYPEREVVQINIDPIAAGGGGIHCITLHQPA